MAYVGLIHLYIYILGIIYCFPAFVGSYLSCLERILLKAMKRPLAKYILVLATAHIPTHKLKTN